MLKDVVNERVKVEKSLLAKIDLNAMDIKSASSHSKSIELLKTDFGEI